MHRQPSSIGVSRKRKSSYLHKVVAEEIQNIALREDKAVSYVIAEIIYSFFGLKVTKSDVVRLARRFKRNRNRAKIIQFKRAS